MEIDGIASKENKLIDLLVRYLRSTSLLLLDLDPESIASFENALEQQETIDFVARFAKSDVTCLYVERFGNSSILISSEIANRTKVSYAGIAFIRPIEEPLDVTKSLAAQIQIMTLTQTYETMNSSIAALLQCTRHIYTPIVRLCGQQQLANESPSATASSGSSPAISSSSVTPELALVSQKIRELELALEQCQRGTSIPRVILPFPTELERAAALTSSNALKVHLEKFNASHVDQLFAELGLARAMGDLPDAKEEFASEVNKSARHWPTEINRLTRLIDSSPYSGNAETETSFWKNLEARLLEVKDQLENSSIILLTKIVLKRTNRVSEQLIRESEAELDRSLELVQVSVAFLRDFPMDELLTSSDLHPKLSRSVASCLQHFSRLKHSRYNFSRAVCLLETLGSATLQKVIALMKEKMIMQCSIEDLRKVKKHSDEVFLAWDSQFAAQRLVLKDVAKRRNEKFIPPQIDQISLLSKRFGQVVEFREQHERLLSVFSAVLHGQENDVVSELNEAWQIVLNQTSANSDIVLDITSAGGTAVWNNVRSMYEKRLEKAEERITRLLEDRLSSADSADDMFRIFSTFNALFFRPAIRNAVNSFRATLVKNVREDVKRLQEKFRLRYDESLEKITANIRDIPPLSGRIIWARQIENQLSTLMKRMEDVLGLGWEDHIEGKQLKEVCDELRNYLSTDALYNEWLSVQLKTDTQKYAKTKDFLLLVDEDLRTHRKSLRVNFDEKQIVVFKEVRFLEWLLPTMTTAHKTIPLTIRSQSKEAYNRYPIAMALQAGLAGFAQAKRGINESNSLLLATHIQAIRDIIKEAFGGSKRAKRWVKWDSVDIEEWSGQFSSKVLNLQERVDDVNEKIKRVGELISKLNSCPYNRKSMSEILSSLQQVVDEMQMRGFTNINAWVFNLDKTIENIIAARLESAIKIWVNAFISGGKHTADKDKETSDTHDSLLLDHTVHEIFLSNQTLFLSPPIEQARSEWIFAFHTYMSIITSLPRLISTRYQVFAANCEQNDYSNTISLIAPVVFRAAIEQIEDKIAAARSCVQQWLQYQALWDASVVLVAERLGNDISKWIQLLTEIRNARVTIDTAEDELSFGPIIINHRQVQKRVNDKYDTWQKEAQQTFGNILMETTKAILADFVSCKTRLESIYLEGGSVKDVIIGVEFILKMKTSLPEKKKLETELETSEKLLRNQRYTFPSNWVAVSNVQSALKDLFQIFERRLTSMEAQLPTLHKKIKEEDSQISLRTEELIMTWGKQRPVDGSLVPVEALELLSILTSQAVKLIEDTERVKGAKEALGLEFLVDDRVNVVKMEIQDLKEALLAVVPSFDRLQGIRSISLKDIVPTKVRKGLEELQDELRNLPAKVRSYAAVEIMQEKLSKHMSAQPVLRDLCTDALKERHWKVLLQGMSITRTPGTSHLDLKIGTIWDSNPLLHKKIISEVLAMAQGELALEQFLRNLREQWLSCELTLAARDGIRLIVGWDVLFSSLEDNLNSLSSLKQSPYFRNVPEFQEDTSNWEVRLTNIRGIFDIWVEVQRKWVYLRGIFRNADIKTQLPAQFSKFKSVDNEFLGLMKRVAQKPSVMELLQIDNLARQLERQDSTMTLIQKALGEYLEKQRQLFPRFYFVNNDDLVEIIGNSNEPAKIVSHLGKMFSALAVVEMSSVHSDDGNNTSLVANSMCSKEGEVVPFNMPVNMSNQGVKEWLNELETQMTVSLATILQDAFGTIPRDIKSSEDPSELLAWIDKYPAQIVILSSQIAWSQDCEVALSDGGQVVEVQKSLEKRLRVLSESVLHDMAPALRKKMEQLLTEMVHQRDVIRLLVTDKVSKKTAFEWLYHLRFYWSQKELNLMQKLCIKMSNATFFYGFEYLGVGERLVQTPLTDRCYLTLTQALHFRMGANPFGPAGTGKTESVKMLGSQFGRFVLVFNCDSSFDYAAMGRIFAGLCQVGAWGCFDEFNRLEERILSAVSQQILTIQRGLMMHQEQIDLMGNPTKLRKEVGIFVTLNPGYAGRSNLPDNLKQLFRAVAMVVPDRKLIAQVMLFSQGIVSAEDLAGKIVLLFNLCEEQLSAQTHYDFGLRALKSVLTGAGELKRSAFALAKTALTSINEPLETIETKVLIKSACDSILPKLVKEDTSLFNSLLKAVFIGCELPTINDDALLEAIKVVCHEDSLECGEKWVEKVLQLKQILDMRHGVMLVGPSCSGKTTAWRTLLKALARVEGVKGDFHVIDPKSIKKEKLYGSLDANTLEWTDGIFTKLLRRVTDAAATRGTHGRRSWIVFDGDVDPEWAENLNSVLDDNKILTLPTGDRLKIPNNVRIMMEVDTLRHATMATVSRCGMVWFAEDTISLDIILRQQLQKLRADSIPMLYASSFGSSGSGLQKMTQAQFADAIAHNFTSSNGLVGVALGFSLREVHIMDATQGRLMDTLLTMLQRGIATAIDFNEQNVDFPMSDSSMELFASKWLLYSILWAFGGSMFAERRSDLGDLLMAHSNADIPKGAKLIDVHVQVSDGAWVEWASAVPKTEIESYKVTASDVVITTIDTLRHVDVLKAWLGSHKPLILCGPPGSGKTMTLTSVLESMPEFVLAALNFSSNTTPDLIHKTFAQYCEVVDSPDGLIMQPKRQTYRESQWLVIFCDEINLPELDEYGTQRVIMFLRQLTEQGGFWNIDCKWVSLRRIQFVGACNPPTDAGRIAMSSRFLRHVPLLLVDYPAEASLKQIYRCFNHALLKLHPNLRSATEPLNEAMVEFYLKNQMKFTPDVAPQYVYSPRELSRWVRAMYEAMEPLEAMSMDELVRLWAHEALRLFQDRLITDEEKEWCDTQLIEIASKHFSSVNIQACLQKPMLYSNWIKKTYQSTDRSALRDFVAARLRVFYEEELDVPLVIFDDVLEHVLRIDNVLRHPMGHLLLVGESGVGKTVLSRFVSWMNGLSVFQVKANHRYTLEQFDDDLRGLLKRVGIEGEKICFIFDESNVLSSAFLERMNALLASGEVPGLFEGDERNQLISACKESYSHKEGLIMDSEDEIWRRFTKLIQRNLHVVFTMNPASSDFDGRCTTSPALFNRCVVDWFGTWSQMALAQVGHEFTLQLDTGYTGYKAPSNHGARPEVLEMVANLLGSKEPNMRDAVVAALVIIHNSVKQLTLKMAKSSGRQHFLSPRDYLDLIRKFVTLEQEKRAFLEEHQTHIRTGLQKLLETQDQVGELRKEMVGKEGILRGKDAEANQKLQQMVEKQNEAEQRKTLAEKFTVELEQQNEEIRVRRETVEGELSEAEPALLSAKQSVQNIRKQQLDEVRALARPPKPVQLTMEVVCLMMGEKNLDWTEIRKVVRRDDFIPTVVNFDPTLLTQKQVLQVQSEYFSNPEFDYASVDRASKACGPLYQWAESQIKYATIIRKIKPLRDEVAVLQDKGNEMEIKQKETMEQVVLLEQSIKQYKTEYASAIRDTEIIRAEMDVVSKKVGRAESLLHSLEQEKVRWQATSASFDLQMSTLIGDCLLAAAFLTYAGIFDHRARKSLAFEWAETLEALHVPHQPELDVVSYLSKQSDQIVWKGHGLPNDDLAVQNAILLERFHRYPLIIDPSGQATNYVLQKYAAQKIAQTSFLDASFLKTLASAIRFGNPLLVQDVESIDPVLNPVLNRELQKTGGRTLIRLGNEEIDFSPKFMIILSTRNPLAKFAPDVCSRVTMVNFTVTPASLESQALSAILKAERPDVDRRRTELLRLQSEQSARLRELEELLLNKISAVQGAILDDDTVIKTLESIKNEAADVNKEVAKTAQVMDEVKSISNAYVPLASAMATVYFSLERLVDLCFLYQFSLQFFLDIIARILTEQAPQKENEKVDPNERLQVLSKAFFVEVCRRVLRGLKFDDKLMFVVRMAQICTQGQAKKELTDPESDFLFRGASSMLLLGTSSNVIQRLQGSIEGRILSDSTARQLASLTLLPTFSGLSTSLGSEADQAVWISFIDSPTPECQVPMSWLTGADKIFCTKEREALLKIIIVRVFRPERVLHAMESYVSAVFGEDYGWRTLCSLDLPDIIADSKASSPLMLCSEAGQDASSKVDVLARSTGKQLMQVSMGSHEGYAEADKSIALAAKSGCWVLLRNVHLCPEWLGLLEKRLYGLASHPNFRLFLTSEMSPALPPSLLRASEVLIAEASTGIKANLQRFLVGIPIARIDRQPAERARLYGLLGWLNAVIQERLRYLPMGWTKKYEFNETDASCALDVIDQWVDDLAGSRAHINPEELPWQALRTLLSQSIYGGRVDHPFDQAALDSFINTVFSASSYGSSTPVAIDTAGKPLVVLPDGLSRQAFEAWVKALPDSNSPAWLGLPVTAEIQLQSVMGQRVLHKLAVLQGAEEEAGSVCTDGGFDSQVVNARQRGLLTTLERWLKIIPSTYATSPAIIARATDSNASSLERTLSREVLCGASSFELVTGDINNLKQYCLGVTKATNFTRDLVNSIQKGQIPPGWRGIFAVGPDVSIEAWISDLTSRLTSQQSYSTLLTGGISLEIWAKTRFWVGGLFQPESFIAATKQHAAQVCLCLT